MTNIIRQRCNVSVTLHGAMTQDCQDLQIAQVQCYVKPAALTMQRDLEPRTMADMGRLKMRDMKMQERKIQNKSKNK